MESLDQRIFINKCLKKYQKVYSGFGLFELLKHRNKIFNFISEPFTMQFCQFNRFNIV